MTAQRTHIATLLLATLLLATPSQGQPWQQPDSSVTLMFVGDVLGHGAQLKCAQQPNGTYSYQRCFAPMREVFALADIVVANLEVPLGGAPYTGYPSFSSPDALAIDLQWAGVDVLVTANNHALDRGLKGIQRTSRTLDSLNILHTGTAHSTQARQTNSPLMLHHNGISIALLSYTTCMNGPTKHLPPYAVNMADTARIRADYQRAKSQGADEVLMFMHWGEEYQRTENAAQRRLAQWLQALGIRLVIGCHPHVLQPLHLTPDTDTQKGQATIYSLGNFVSNQRWRYSDGGLAIMLRLERRKGRVCLTHGAAIPFWVSAPMLSNGTKDFRVFPIYHAEATGQRFGSEHADFAQFAADTRHLLDSAGHGFPEARYDVFTRTWVLPWQPTPKKIEPITTWNIKQWKEN